MISVLKTVGRSKIVPVLRGSFVALVAALLCAQFSADPVGASSRHTSQAIHVSYAPKGHPPVIEAGRVTTNSGTCEDGACYYWATMADSGFTATGASISITQNHPKVATQDYHSLAELAVESSDGRQIVEIGWIVAPDVNGDSRTHLFVYHWVNGSGSCYNGCGFVSTSTKYTPGGLVKVGTVGTYAIHYSTGKWMLTYDGVKLGYFPESLWSGQFKSIGLVQAFGEVASSSATRPRSQMGNGVEGTSSKAADLTKFSLIGANTTPTLSYSTIGAPAVYKIGHYTPTCTASCQMAFGGPGY
jgi:hypothetical protein